MAASVQLGAFPCSAVSFFHGEEGLNLSVLRRAVVDYLHLAAVALRDDSGSQSGAHHNGRSSVVEKMLGDLSRVVGFENATLLLAAIRDAMPASAVPTAGKASASTCNDASLLLRAIHTGLVSVSSSLEGQLPGPA